MAAEGQIFTGFDASVLKEPRGILKPIQWILSIFAFATMTGVQLSLSFQVTCMHGTGNDTTSSVNTFNIKSTYPYALEDVGTGSETICNTTGTNLLQGASSSAMFYVFVGVMVFLYCLAALGLYLFCDEFYRKHNRVIIADFIVSMVIVLLWLISSSAWAQGVTDLKYYTDLSESGYFKEVKDCQLSTAQCTQLETPNFASLNVSILFGFLNMCVWAGNLWFLYKETPWHKVQQTKPPSIPGQATEGDPQRI